jgi:hypothetical protein
MRAKIGSDEKPGGALAEGFGGSKVEAGNEVRPDFRPGSETRAPRGPRICAATRRDGAAHLSIPGSDFVGDRREKTPGIRRSSLLEPKNWLPSPSSY